MSGRGGSSAAPPTVIVGVDGSGRTHRLDQIAATTGGTVVRVVTPPAEDAGLERVLRDAAREGFRVLVDDAHRLPPSTLALLTDAGRRGARLVIARRPGITGPELAALDSVAAGQGRVEQLEPLDAEAVTELVLGLGGRRLSPEAAERVVVATAGLPALVTALMRSPGGGAGDPPADLAARVHRRSVLLDQRTALLLRVLSLGPDLHGRELGDQHLAEVVGGTRSQLAESIRELRDGGLLLPDAERVVPCVASAVLAELTPTERRQLHDLLAAAMLSATTDPVAVATRLRAAHTRSPAAAEAFRFAGERLRFSDPATATGWFEDAVEAGADPSRFALCRAEASAALGLPADLDAVVPADPAESARLRLLEGAAAALEGRAARSAEALLAAGPPGDCLAVPALVAVGRGEQARTAATGPAPAPVRLLAQAVLGAARAASALPLFIEAAEALEAAAPALILPDTPHALGALVAVTAGDASCAENLLHRALTHGCGGPRATQRHRLLLAWARLRSGRFETAVAEVHRLRGVPLPGRDRLLAAALAAGLARRSGDITALGEAWTRAEPELARRTVDLFHLEVVEELAVAGARLRRHQRIEPALQVIEEAAAGLDPSGDWAAAAAWVRLQVAVVSEDPAAAAAAAHRLADIDAPGARQQAQTAAAGVWADALAGRVDPPAVLAAATGLAEVELPWEGSRLAGQAAIRCGDPVAARRLLEAARELGGHDPTPAAGVPQTAAGVDSRLAGLSEREVDVARLVLAGHTHREIGSQLYIAPKTVEHHVARIRTKLGATTRAEFMAALRETFRQEAPGIQTP
ncbi:MAG: hypothetical protein JNL54_18600 [Kineosporiaceae bacterium]|nr:hypothetical protein [Kineosporiaceae bacterium]